MKPTGNETLVLIPLLLAIALPGCFTPIMPVGGKPRELPYAAPQVLKPEPAKLPLGKDEGSSAVVRFRNERVLKRFAEHPEERRQWENQNGTDAEKAFRTEENLRGADFYWSEKERCYNAFLRRSHTKEEYGKMYDGVKKYYADLMAAEKGRMSEADWKKKSARVYGSRDASAMAKLMVDNNYTQNLARVQLCPAEGGATACE